MNPSASEALNMFVPASTKPLDLQLRFRSLKNMDISHNHTAEAELPLSQTTARLFELSFQSLRATPTFLWILSSHRAHRKDGRESATGFCPGVKDPMFRPIHNLVHKITVVPTLSILPIVHCLRQQHSCSAESRMGLWKVQESSEVKLDSRPCSRKWLLGTTCCPAMAPDIGAQFIDRVVEIARLPLVASWGGNNSSGLVFKLARALRVGHHRAVALNELQEPPPTLKCTAEQHDSHHRGGCFVCAVFVRWSEAQLTLSKLNNHSQPVSWITLRNPHKMFRPNSSPCSQRRQKQSGIMRDKNSP